MEKRREYIDKMAARLKELNNEINELEAIADKAVAEVKAEYRRQIEELFLKKEKLQNKVEKIREASGNAWEDMKAGEEMSWDVYRKSVKRKQEKQE
jgi:hypothetical protein